MRRPKGHKIAALRPSSAATNVFDSLNSLPKVLEAAHEGKIAGKLVVVMDKNAVEKGK